MLQFCCGKLYCNTSIGIVRIFNVEIMLCNVVFENKTL